MILSCQLICFFRKGQEAEDTEVELLSKKKRAISIEPRPDIAFYKFRVDALVEYTDISIELNDVESWKFQSVDDSNGIHRFESGYIDAKKFLRFNLGYYNFSLLYKDVNSDYESVRLSSLRNTQSLITAAELDFIYQSVVDSEFFTLFVSRLLRGNTRAEAVSNKNLTHDFWLRSYLIREYVSFVDQILDKKQRVLNLAKDKSEVKDYSASLDFLPRDIDWLLDNPQHVTRGNRRDVSFGARSLSIEKIQHSVIGFSGDIYENRLILFTLLMMADYLGREILDAQKNGLPVLLSRERIYDSIQSKLQKLKTLFDIQQVNIEVPSLSPLFIDDPFYSRGFFLISSWFSLKNISLGESFSAPVPDVTKVFEFFCVSQVVMALKKYGFEISTYDMKGKDELANVSLVNKKIGTIQVFYEPKLSHDSNIDNFPIAISSQHHKLPDIVLVFENSLVKRIGVIDPKFTSTGQIDKYSKDIFYKYGLFFHKTDGSPIDYVASIFPNLSDMNAKRNYRSGIYADSVKPFLGILSIPLNGEKMMGFDDALVEFILG